MRKALVTGAAGFIGSNLCVSLDKYNYEVIGIDNYSRLGVSYNLDTLDVPIINGDITDASIFKDLPHDIDVVFHLAASADKPVEFVDARSDFNINAYGTLNVLEFCKNINAPIIFASSSKVYSAQLNNTLHLKAQGSRLVPSARNSTISSNLYPDLTQVRPINSRSPYGCSKLTGELYCQEYHAAYGVPFVINRMSCIYGPNQFGNSKQGWFTWLIIAKILGQPFTVYGDGYQVRDLLYIDDLVDLFIEQFNNIGTINGSTYVVGGGFDNSISVMEAIELVDREVPGDKLSIRYGQCRLSDHAYFVAELEHIKSDISWHPRTSIPIGLVKVSRWVRERRLILKELIND